jgi:acetolactate synthase-1/2/3 large subunit
MKFSAASVFLLVATPSSFAFLPSKASPKSPAFVSSPYFRSTGPLSSTTEDDIEILKHSIANNFRESDAKLASAARQQKKPDLKNSDPKLAQIAAVETRAAVSAYLSQYQGQSGAAIIYSKLVEHGVEVVNGFSGGAVLPLLDQFHELHPRHEGKKPIRWITNSNENSAGHIAEGYGKSQPFGGKHLPVGVCIATSGPGLTNLITPLQDAICDGVPLVALCGQAATNAPKDAFQSCPAVDLTRPCTKWAYQIKSAAELPMVLDYAFYVARNGRPGPVFVDLPKDLQNQILTPELMDSFVETNLNEPNYDTAFCRLSERRRADGSLIQAVHIGTEGKGLPFQIIKDAENKYQIDAIPVVEETADTRDDFHADHNPTHMIVKNTPNGETLKEMAFDEGSAMAKEVLNLIRQARKPVILAGQGCNDAPEDLKYFAEKLQIPVATTLHALGCFDERSPLALNMVGMHGHPTPNFMFQESDLVICVGSRFDDRITGRMGSYIPKAREAAEEGRGGIIHVDIRRTEHKKQLAPSYFVHTTGKRFLQTMNALLHKDTEFGRASITAPWLKHMAQLQKDFPVKIPHFKTESIRTVNEQGEETMVPRTRMSAQSVVAELNRQLLEAGQMDNAVFTTGVGVHQMIAAQLITWTQPRQMLSSGSLGTMGVSLGYCIGAKLANPGKICISVDGDGSFNMTFTELKTLKEEGIAVKLMIIDNDGQMMVEYWQRLFHNNRLLAVRNTANPDYCTLAKAFGIKSVYCDAEEDLEAAMKDFLFNDPDEPVLFHVRVERTPCLPLVAPGQPLDDMILEDVEVDVDGAAAPS